MQKLLNKPKVLKTFSSLTCQAEDERPGEVGVPGDLGPRRPEGVQHGQRLLQDVLRVDPQLLQQRRLVLVVLPARASGGTSTGSRAGAEPRVADGRGGHELRLGQ